MQQGLVWFWAADVSPTMQVTVTHMTQDGHVISDGDELAVKKT